ncbi:hypothetical protein K9N68_21830 [Kovacikia minuta CCNUW1]|uniref:ABC transporter permease/M1 family aminopeptidase n=1 Tax=Kovacikia minuta TaxID=2931930 RepID=UPI001CCE3C3B|nr:M1 family aminopeptidase [Kovacikia minuta]UBF24331.1 hypothetical protein K9N68_21830 [Kovacikia minuta CCNUW1]
MRSLLTIARFELRELLKSPAIYVYLLIFVGLGIGVAGAAAYVFSQRPVIEYFNSPNNIAQYLNGLLTILVVFFLPLLLADLACKDFENNFGSLMFTCPVRKWEYLGGRLLAGVAAGLVVFLGAGMGLTTGAYMPWINVTRRTSFSGLAYLLPYLYVVLPTLIIFGVIYLVIGVLTRQSSVVIRSGLILFILLSLWGGFLGILGIIPGLGFLKTLLDISGTLPDTNTWTIAQKNTQLLFPDFSFLLNRILWLGAAIALLGWAASQLQFAPDAKTLQLPFPFLKPRPTSSPPSPPALHPSLPPIPPAHPSFTFKDHLARVVHIGWTEFQFLIQNLFTWVLIVGIVVSLFLAAFQAKDPFYHAALSPTTGRMLDTLNSVSQFLITIVLIYLAGDLLWRERNARMNAFTDALPVPTWAVMLGKFLGLTLLLLIPLLLGMVACLAVQIVQGYFHLNPGIYLFSIFTLTLPKLLLIAALTLFIQVLVNHKAIGYALSALIIFSSSLLKAPLQALIPLPWSLVLYGQHPAVEYSDISGYGNTLTPAYWYLFYWGWLAVLLLAIAVLFWQRGVETSFPARLKQVRSRLSMPIIVTFLSALIAFLLTGSWIVANVLQPDALQDLVPQQVAYEKAYKSLEYAQPRITAVDLNWDYFPEAKRLHSRGRYQLQNKTHQPIALVLVTLPQNNQVKQLALGNQTTLEKTESVGSQVVRPFRLSPPLAPGGTTELTFDFERNLRTLSDPPDTVMNANGAFLSEANQRFMPRIGYDRTLELADAEERKQNGLPLRPAALAPSDPNARRESNATPDADRVNFSATVSTSHDQIAVMPGELQRDWVEGDRHYFTYKSPQPIVNFYTLVSGAYSRRVDRWKDVQLEIFHHPDHAANVPSMMLALQQGLDYYTKNWGPYPFKQLRLMEVPYASFGQAYPGLIVFGEDAGFLFKTDPTNPNVLNPAFEITAHELAHQWWGQQFTPANALGAAPAAEIMAQYGALVVLEKTFGAQILPPYLQKAQDSYGGISPGEVPLIASENLKTIYPKGTIALYALKEAIGEDKLNQALSQLLKQFANVPPYPTVNDLVAAFRTVIPPDRQYLITDLFETVTGYRLNTQKAVWQRRPDGQYEVKLAIEVDKLRQVQSSTPPSPQPTSASAPASIPGFSSVPMNDWVDIGIKDEKGKFLYLQPQRLQNGVQEITVTVSQQPAEAGIDPIQKLISIQGNRVIPVTEAGHHGNPNS